MNRRFPSRLQTRIVLPIIICLVLLVTGFALAAFATVDESTKRIYQERLIIAQVIADRVEAELASIIQMLEWVVDENEFDLENPRAESNQRAMRTLFAQLEGKAHFVGLMNQRGVKVWTEPYYNSVVGVDFSASPAVQNILTGDSQFITKVFTLEGAEPSAAIAVGIKDSAGSMIGMLTLDLNLTHPDIANLLSPVGLGKNSYADIVDQNGVVLASTQPDRLWLNVDRGEHFSHLMKTGSSVVIECDDCYEDMAADNPANEIVAFTPLSTAPWGVAVWQQKSDAMAYTTLLKMRNLAISGAVVIVAFVITSVISRRVVGPAQSLAAACKTIAEGNLDQPIPIHTTGELVECAQYFEQFRIRLIDSMEEIKALNRELKHKVRQRSEELQESEQARRKLLHKLVIAQEEERQRLARELHDETSQDLTAIMIALETVVRRPAETVEEVKQSVAAIQPQIQVMLAEINRIIRDLRPSILDDLGLAQAIDWLAEHRLSPLGIQAKVWTIGFERRFSSEVETIIYRIVQESITNIIRHAQPNSVNITLSFREFHCLLIIEDDGIGFGHAETERNEDSRVHNGLLGMKERAALIDGDLTISSKRGNGTRIVCQVPYQGARDG
jgi:signal transduction histidine kinase